MNTALHHSVQHPSASPVHQHCSHFCTHRLWKVQSFTEASRFDVGVKYVSSPIFGRPDAALEHRVLFAVAGPKDAKQKLQKYFDWMGRGTLVSSDPLVHPTYIIVGKLLRMATLSLSDTHDLNAYCCADLCILAHQPAASDCLIGMSMMCLTQCCVQELP